ncbi:MAG: hypothetical protein PSV36_14215 [Algoriphagus sp.]|nr:hypothetical protein [Algoriphagus sp.]
MFETSSFSFKKLGVCVCAVVGMCLWTEDALAQGEQEKAEIENIRNMDKPALEDQTSSQEAVSSKISASKQTQPVLKATVVRKENLTNGEGKKVDPSSAPSTLSFNMFLYIVDKFKAD